LSSRFILKYVTRFAFARVVPFKWMEKQENIGAMRETVTPRWRQYHYPAGHCQHGESPKK
jgi:hypothetical protein